MIQIGKYRRPGIFQEEIDKSLVSAVNVEGIANLVIGVSKKGVVNTPVLLKSIADLEAVYGGIDRQLERKGSYFHRTIAKMLETAPVYAINLLLTDDNLDNIEYYSLSGASSYSNDVERTAPYRRFFETSGFWKEDTDSFLTLVKENEGSDKRLINLTNMSDKAVTVFIFKSKLTGYDRSLIEWFGGVEKLPTYLNAKDYASDYMVDVLIVAGDYTDYQSLSVDKKFKNYFTSKGLRKEQVRNFSVDRNVTTLSFIEGASLIPNFRNLNGDIIFIESLINKGTKTHGIFCAFNSDLFETDYPTGLIDIIGNNFAGEDILTSDYSDGQGNGKVEINFLSYKDTISELMNYEQKPLDLPNNVIYFGEFGSNTGFDSEHYFNDNNYIGGLVSGNSVVGNNSPTIYFNEGYVNDFLVDNVTIGSNGINIDFDLGDNAYVVKEGALIKLNSTSVNIPSSYYAPVSSTASSFYATLIVNNEGGVDVIKTTSKATFPNVSTSDLVLGFASFSCVGTTVSSVTLHDINMNMGTSSTSSYNHLEEGVDYTLNIISPNEFKIEFTDTNKTITNNDYIGMRKVKLFNNLINQITSPNASKSVLYSQGKYYNVKESVNIINIQSSKNVNKSFEIKIDGIEFNDTSDKFEFALYKSDNQFTVGVYGADEIGDGSDYGRIGKDSDLYKAFVNGLVNTSDVLLQKINAIPVGVSLVKGTDELFGYDFLVVSVDNNKLNSIGLVDVNAINNTKMVLDYINDHDGYKLLINTSKNTGVFETKVDFALNPSLNPEYSGTLPVDASDRADILGFQSNSNTSYYAYEIVTRNFVEETTIVDALYSYNLESSDKPLKLNMYVKENGDMKLEFSDKLESVVGIPQESVNNVISIKSLDGNFKQTIEIEEVLESNRILVSADRYTEVKVGDYLEAFYNIDTLEVGQMPRKLTRITSKRVYRENTDLVEISTDSEINIITNGDEISTFRYTQIDDYVSTYKGIELKGFKRRLDTLPNGTDERQVELLNVVAKGTPLFKAITNKETFDFRYLIDSFGLGLTENSKQQLVDICGERLDCFGILNMPSMKQFKNSSSPRFTDEEGRLVVEHIANGGDLESNPIFTYSMGDGRGNTTVGYFCPYLTIDDAGRDINVPPSAYVGTAYMRKHNSTISSITPWTVVASVTNGRILGIKGLEKDFTNEDIEFLNMAQFNPIVTKRNRGFSIETENTALTEYKSSLSTIHAREVLIELERELASMLLDYHRKFNTPEIRAEIKLKADQICAKYQAKDGIYDYFNKCDGENNTREIIDNDMGVLDTYVEITKDMAKIVNQITILPTGAIVSGGFI